jgi:hypothetical protein
MRIGESDIRKAIILRVRPRKHKTCRTARRADRSVPLRQLPLLQRGRQRQGRHGARPVENGAYLRDHADEPGDMLFIGGYVPWGATTHRALPFLLPVRVRSDHRAAALAGR